MAIGLVVAGAGVAGLHYRNQLWDDHGHPDHVATTPEPTFALPVTLTNADQPAATVILAPPEKEDAKPDAAAPPPPRPTQPKARPPVATKKAAAKPDKKEEAPSESEMFSKPD